MSDIPNNIQHLLFLFWRRKVRKVLKFKTAKRSPYLEKPNFKPSYGAHESKLQSLKNKQMNRCINHNLLMNSLGIKKIHFKNYKTPIYHGQYISRRHESLPNIALSTITKESVVFLSILTSFYQYKNKETHSMCCWSDLGI